MTSDTRRQRLLVVIEDFFNRNQADLVLATADDALELRLGSDSVLDPRDRRQELGSRARSQAAAAFLEYLDHALALHLGRTSKGSANLINPAERKLSNEPPRIETELL